MLKRIAAMLSIALIGVAALVIPGSAGASAPNKGDTWLTNAALTANGHDHEPHLDCGVIYMHGSDLAASGTYSITSIPSSGNGAIVVTGTWTSPVTGDVIATLNGSALVAAAIAIDGATAHPIQGFHFKLDLEQTGIQTGDLHKTFWVKCGETPAEPSLGVTKTADASPVVSGSDIGFTVVAGTNSFADDAVLNDPLPAGAGINWSISPAYSGPGSCSITGSVPTQVLACSFGDLGDAPLASSATVHISSHTVAGTTAALTALTVTNTATASGDDLDPVNSTAHIVINPFVITPVPNLQITKTADAVTVTAGSQVGFTVAVHNAGPGSAVSATLSDPLPGIGTASWSINPTYSGPGTCSITGSAPSQTLGCTFGTMASGDSASVHMIGTSAATAATLTNLATASADNNAPVTATAHVDTLVPAQTPPAPSLAITKVADSVTVTAGSQIGFTVSVANNGAGAATNATLSDPLPVSGAGSWSISPAYSGPGSCAITGASQPQTLGCSFGNLAGGATASVHVVASTPVGTAVTLRNTATVVADNNPPVSATAQVGVDVPAPAASVLPLALTKTPAPTPSPSTSVLGLSLTRPASGSLPRTGGVPINLVYPALFLLLTGGVLMVAGRKRNAARAIPTSTSGTTPLWAAQSRKSRWFR